MINIEQRKSNIHQFGTSKYECQYSSKKSRKLPKNHR